MLLVPKKGRKCNKGGEKRILLLLLIHFPLIWKTMKFFDMVPWESIFGAEMAVLGVGCSLVVVVLRRVYMAIQLLVVSRELEKEIGEEIQHV